MTVTTILCEYYVKYKTITECQRKVSQGWSSQPNAIQNVVNKVKTTSLLTDRKPEYQGWVLTQEKFDDTKPQLQHSLFMHLAEETETSMSLRTTTELCNHGLTKPEFCTFFRHVQQLL
jgi:hypothetical protein